jgi:hypothetical protein
MGLETLAMIGTVVTAAATGVSLLRTLNTKAPKPPEINYDAHNAQVDSANEAAANQQRLLDQETRRLTGQQQSEEAARQARQNAVLRMEQDNNSRARQDQLRLLEVESAGIETALRENARKETAVLDRKEKQKKIALITGTTGRRSLLTSTALGYKRKSFGK